MLVKCSNSNKIHRRDVLERIFLHVIILQIQQHKLCVINVL